MNTQVFTNDEIDVAMELVDQALNDQNQKDYQIYTYKENKKLIGYYCVGPTPLTMGTYDLYWIVVEPNSHKRGIGKMLLKHAEDTVKSQGGRLIIVETSSQPKYKNTRKFYQGNKYEELARIKDYYQIGDDLVIYGKYV